MISRVITITSVQVITAVIPVYNRADLLQRLLATLRAQTVQVAEIIVVDNASTDGAPDVARKSGCRVITLSENKGFAHAVNCGWQAAATPWVAILNSDVELDPRWVQNLLANTGPSSFATGLILDIHNKTLIDGTYDLVSRAACAWRAGKGEASAVTAGHSRPIAIAPGTACLFRTDVLRCLGGYDERYGSYLEDVDLGLRCLREGFTGVYVPAAVAWHHGSATLGRWNPAVVRLISRNQLLLVARHYDRSLFWACLWPIVMGQLLWGLLACRHGAALAWLAGKFDGMRGFRLAAEPNPRLQNFLSASEREIRERARGAYWRLYFLLTPRAAVCRTSPSSGSY
jgi:GT2 family glycosyltransferase